MSDIKFNINSFVKVKLTDAGRIELKRQHDTLRSKHPTIAKYVYPIETNGWSKWQLWSLMSKLGHLIYMGGPSMFDSNIIIVTDGEG